MNGTTTQYLEDRDAVYYPYIHVRDKQWLNRTLLYFPHLVRMVPRDYRLRDALWVREYFDTLGRRDKPLLQTIDFWQEEVRNVQKVLAAKLQEDIEAQGPPFIERLNHAATLQHPSKDTFRISKDRLIGIGATCELYKVLMDNELIWEASAGEFGIHPVLGEAVMATVAMALAARDGMDVVTPRNELHDVLAARQADAIYDVLVRGKPAVPVHGPHLVDDLASLVVLDRFDVAPLSPKDIADLHKSGEDLAAFRSELAKLVAKIPAMSNRALREEYLREMAEVVLNEWQKRRLNLSNFARSLYSPDALDVGKDAAKVILGGLLGGAKISLASVGAGLIVGVVWYAAERAVEVVQQARPYRWLSKIHKAGATFQEYRVAAPPESIS